MLGNRLSAEKSKTYSYGAANELVSESGVVYTYDRNGNTIGKSDGTTYAYDYENRLTKVTKADGTVVEFKYDVFGRRIEKRVIAGGLAPSPSMGEGWGGGEGVTRYFYDNEDILVEYDGAGNAGNKYTHGPGIDEPLALTNDKGNYYYHADGLGSIVAITDKAQTVVQDYQYDWYGNLKDLKNRIKQPYAYTGREFDRETGLYFYRARYYDASVGRFLTRDPIGFRGGMNLYAYVKANPVNYTDPWGELLKDADGNIRFDFILKTLESYTNPVTNVTITAIMEYGYIYADNGKRFVAGRYISGDEGFKTNCHGLTFTDGKFWLGNPDIQPLLEGDGYKITYTPKKGDVVVYYKNGEVVHSGIVVAVVLEDGKYNVTLVRHEYGYMIGIIYGKLDDPLRYMKYDEIRYYRK